MPAKALGLPFPCREERQVGQYIVELGAGFSNLENTDICIPGRRSAQICRPYFPFGLQIMAHRFFLLPSIFSELATSISGGRFTVI